MNKQFKSLLAGMLVGTLALLSLAPSGGGGSGGGGSGATYTGAGPIVVTGTVISAPGVVTNVLTTPFLAYGFPATIAGCPNTALNGTYGGTFPIPGTNAATGAYWYTNNANTGYLERQGTFGGFGMNYWILTTTPPTGAGDIGLYDTLCWPYVFQSYELINSRWETGTTPIATLPNGTPVPAIVGTYALTNVVNQSLSQPTLFPGGASNLPPRVGFANLGDSITAGLGYSLFNLYSPVIPAVYGQESAASTEFQILSERGHIKKYINAGYGGINVSGLNGATNVWGPSFLTNGVDVVSLMIGINDALSGTTVVTFSNNYVLLIGNIRKFVPRVIVNYQPGVGGAYVNASVINALNYSYYQAIASTVNGVNVFFGDTNSWMQFATNNALYASDSLHPGPLGHYVLGRNWADAFLLLQGEKIIPQTPFFDSIVDNGSLTIALDASIGGKLIVIGPQTNSGNITLADNQQINMGNNLAGGYWKYAQGLQVWNGASVSVASGPSMDGSGFNGDGKRLINVIHTTTSTATSGTVTAATGYQSETTYLSSASTITSITVANPAATTAGQKFYIHSKSIVSTLAVTGGSYADAAVITMTAGQTIGYQAVDAAGTYVRIQ